MRQAVAVCLQRPHLRDRLWFILALQLALIVALFPVPGLAVEYQAQASDSRWSVEGSVFNCALSHDIPYYGSAVFSHRAGEPAKFILHEITPRMNGGKAQLQSLRPHWKSFGHEKDYGLVSVHKGKTPLHLNWKAANWMLTELHDGMNLVATRRPWYLGNDEQSMEVVINPANFAAAYEQYLACQQSLLPVNFDQIARTKIYFASGKEDLPASEKRKLDHIALYVKHDPSVSAYIIDGHTDAQGRRDDNLTLSQMRAEQVTLYLTSRGIDKDQVTVRWHGERYPVASNRTRKGRAMNRRVTIRLDRGDLPDDMAAPSISRAPQKSFSESLSGDSQGPSS